MPLNPITSGLITTGVGVATNLFDNIFNGRQTREANNASRQFAQHQYDQQRTDALTDRDFQNNYNSPAAQMERLKAAGLNPNLVYGNGAAQTQSAQTRASSGGSYKAEPVRVDTSGASSAVTAGLNQAYNLAMLQAQTNNLQANHDVLVQDALLKKSQEGLVHEQTNTQLYEQSGIDAERRLKEFDLRQKTRLADIEVTKGNLENSKIAADTKFTLNQDQRAEALKSMSLSEAAARILNMSYNNAKTDAERQRIGQEIQNLKTDNQLKSMDAELKAEGIQPHDNLFMRVLGNFMNRIAPSALQSEPTH